MWSTFVNNSDFGDSTMAHIEISALDHCTGRQLKELLALAHRDAGATPNWLLEIELQFNPAESAVATSPV
jgi:hypothetical protein